jgi:formylmethanofuran dehydrogenase subunit E
LNKDLTGLGNLSGLSNEDMLIGSYSFEEYYDKVTAFHSYAAPGVLIGGFLVSVAQQHLPTTGLYDAIAETKKCLPDAIQLLTPCTIGNGWLKILDIGRFAAVLYDKHTGAGVRVWVDVEKLRAWPDINSWFFSLIPKQAQDKHRLVSQIQAAGADLFSIRAVTVQPHFLHKHKNKIVVCPICGEAYPASDETMCKGCQEALPYM